MKTISEAQLNQMKMAGSVKSTKKPPQKKMPPLPDPAPSAAPAANDKMAEQMTQAVKMLGQLSAAQLDQVSRLVQMVADKPEQPGIRRMNVIRNAKGLIDYVEFE